MTGYIVLLFGPLIHYWMQSGTRWVRYLAHGVVFVAVFVLMATWASVSAFNSIKGFLL